MVKVLKTVTIILLLLPFSPTWVLYHHTRCSSLSGFKPIVCPSRHCGIETCCPFSTYPKNLGGWMASTSVEFWLSECDQLDSITNEVVRHSYLLTFDPSKKFRKSNRDPIVNVSEQTNQPSNKTPAVQRRIWLDRFPQLMDREAYVRVQEHGSTLVCPQRIGVSSLVKM